MMRRFLLLLFCLPLLASFLYEGDRPSRPLLEMLALHGVEHDGSWESIVCETQKQLRKPTEELWDLENNGQDPERIYELCTELGMTEAQHPSQEHYTYGVIVGATKQMMRTRLHFLLNEGVSFDELVVLVGNRPLQSWEGPESDETEAMLALLEEVEIAVPITLVITKCEGRRPNTGDTFLTWAPRCGEALITSSQPFIGRQGAIAENCLAISFEMTGPGLSMEELKQKPNGCAILWETLIRWIHATRAMV